MVSNGTNSLDPLLSTTIALVAKHLEFKTTFQPPTTRRRFDVAWSEFGVILGQQGLPNAADALAALKQPLLQPFKNEKDFDLALFNALKDCLEQRIVEVAGMEHFLLKPKTKGIADEDYANKHLVGISRHKNVALGLHPTNVPGRVFFAKEAGSNGMTYDSKPDHAVCIFESEANRTTKWIVTDCFAVVELKTSHTTCGDFELTTDANICHLVEPSISGIHKTLGQALLYTLGGVLPYHARRGSLRQSLPVAIVAGKKEGDDRLIKPVDDECKARRQKSQGGLRWVSASVGIPEGCGQNLDYAIKDFDHFYLDAESEESSIEGALVLYIDTLAFGMRHAFSVLAGLERGEMLSAKPASGQFLKIGDKTLDCEFCASPIAGAVLSVNDGKGQLWKVSQGELFAGTLNIKQTLRNCKGRYVDFRDASQIIPENAKVLVKVSSLVVHNLLIDPFFAYNALDDIRWKDPTRVWEQAALNGALDPNEALDPMTAQQMAQKRLDLQTAHAVLLSEIRSVLYAAVQTDAGMLTLMADLSNDFETLSLQKYQHKRSVLWAGFRNLVANVLLPLANMHFVHADIRPGFDETTNVLFKFEVGDDSVETATMKLIDFESIVDIARWISPANGSYIKKESSWTATTFVWWQCVAVAYAWKFEIQSKDFFGQRDLVHRLKKQMHSSESWILQCKRFAEVDSIPQSAVIETLVQLSNGFE